MERFKKFREQSRRVERKMAVVEHLLEALEEAVDDYQKTLGQWSEGAVIQPTPRRLPGIWRRRIDPSLN